MSVKQRLDGHRASEAAITRDLRHLPASSPEAQHLYQLLRRERRMIAMLTEADREPPPMPEIPMRKAKW